MNTKDLSAIQEELAQLRARVAQLEEEQQSKTEVSSAWTKEYYLTYYATTGFFLGMIAALASLMFNAVGSLAIGQHPMQIIKVYLTFGLGERALDPTLETGLILAIGCCLYIATGALLGALFQVVLSRIKQAEQLIPRLLIASGLGMAVWVVNYYLLLSWLQPLMFGGNWILTEIPVGVAILTHLVFGWTMALLYPMGKFVPYSTSLEK